MSVEVEAAILKIRAELSGDALKQVDKELKKLGLTVAKTGKDGSESLVKIDKTLGKTDGTLKKINTSFTNLETTVQKLGEAVDRLTAKNKENSESTKKSEESTKSAEKSFIELAAKVTVAYKALDKFFTAAVAGAKADLQLKQSIQNNTTEFSRQGDTVNGLAGEYDKYAKARDKITNLGTSAIKQQIGLLLAMGAAPKEVKRITEAFQDMAAATGISVDTMARAWGRLAENPEEALGALTRAGIKLDKQMLAGKTIAEQKIFILEKIEARYRGQAEAVAEAEGAYGKFNSAISSLTKALGNLAVDILSPLLSVLSALVNGFSSLGSGMQSLIVFLAGGGVAWMQYGKKVKDVLEGVRLQTALAGGGFSGFVKNSIAGIKSLGASLLAFVKTNPILVFAGAITALALVFKKTEVSIESVKEDIDALAVSLTKLEDAKKAEDSMKKLLMEVWKFRNSPTEYDKAVKRLIGSNEALKASNLSTKSSFLEMCLAVGKASREMKVKAEAEAISGAAKNLTSFEKLYEATIKDVWKFAKDYSKKVGVFEIIDDARRDSLKSELGEKEFAEMYERYIAIQKELYVLLDLKQSIARASDVTGINYTTDVKKIQQSASLGTAFWDPLPESIGDEVRSAMIQFMNRITPTVRVGVIEEEKEDTTKGGDYTPPSRPSFDFEDLRIRAENLNNLHQQEVLLAKKAHAERLKLIEESSGTEAEKIQGKANLEVLNEAELAEIDQKYHRIRIDAIEDEYDRRIEEAKLAHDNDKKQIEELFVHEDDKKRELKEREIRYKQEIADIEGERKEEIASLGEKLSNNELAQRKRQAKKEYEENLKYIKKIAKDKEQMQALETAAKVQYDKVILELDAENFAKTFDKIGNVLAEAMAGAAEPLDKYLDGDKDGAKKDLGKNIKGAVSKGLSAIPLYGKALSGVFDTATALFAVLFKKRVKPLSEKLAEWLEKAAVKFGLALEAAGIIKSITGNEYDQDALDKEINTSRGTITEAAIKFGINPVEDRKVWKEIVDGIISSNNKDKIGDIVSKWKKNTYSQRNVLGDFYEAVFRYDEYGRIETDVEGNPIAIGLTYTGTGESQKEVRAAGQILQADTIRGFIALQANKNRSEAEEKMLNMYQKNIEKFFLEMYGSEAAANAMMTATDVLDKNGQIDIRAWDAYRKDITGLNKVFADIIKQARDAFEKLDSAILDKGLNSVLKELEGLESDYNLGKISYKEMTDAALAQIEEGLKILRGANQSLPGIQDAIRELEGKKYDLEISGRVGKTREDLDRLNTQYELGNKSLEEMVKQATELIDLRIKELESLLAAEEAEERRAKIQDEINGLLLDRIGYQKRLNEGELLDRYGSGNLGSLLAQKAELDMDIASGKKAAGTRETVAEQEHILRAIVAELKAQGAPREVWHPYEEELHNIMSSYGGASYHAASGQGYTAGLADIYKPSTSFSLGEFAAAYKSPGFDNLFSVPLPPAELFIPRIPVTATAAYQQAAAAELAALRYGSAPAQVTNNEITNTNTNTTNTIHINNQTLEVDDDFINELDEAFRRRFGRRLVG